MLTFEELDNNFTSFAKQETSVSPLFLSEDSSINNMMDFYEFIFSDHLIYSLNIQIIFEKMM